MAKYKARYNSLGEKVYEEIDDVVTIDQGYKVNTAGYFVMDDIKPYKSMQTGEMITSRSQHRNHLKQHGLIEIGNEKIQERKQERYSSHEVKQELAKHFYR